MYKLVNPNEILCSCLNGPPEASSNPIDRLSLCSSVRRFVRPAYT